MPRLRAVSWVDDENDFGDQLSQHADGNSQLDQNSLRQGSFAAFQSSISIPSRNPSRNPSIVTKDERRSQTATLNSTHLRSRLEEVCICGGSTMGGTVVAVVSRTLGKTNKGIGNSPPLQCFVLSDKGRLITTTTTTTTPSSSSSPEKITEGNDKESSITPHMDLIFAARIGFAASRALCATMPWRFADQMVSKRCGDSLTTTTLLIS